MKKIKYNKIITDGVPSKAFVMIHGWKGNKDSFKSIPFLLKISDCAWYFPEGPYMVNEKDDKKSWAYQHSNGQWEMDEPKALLKDFIDNVVLKEFDPANVFIMGFSQGAAVCYEFILTLDYPFGGVFPIGGFIRDEKSLTNISSVQRDVPILIGHGADDDVVSPGEAKRAYDLLSKYCNNVSLHMYNGKHKIGIEYLKKVKEIVDMTIKQEV